MSMEVERTHLADRMSPTREGFGQAQTEVAPLAEPKLSHAGFWLAASAVSLFTVYLFWQLIRFGGEAHATLIGDAFFIPADLLAVCAMALASRNCRADRRRFWSWAFVSVAMVGYLIGDLLQLYHEGVRHFSDSPDWSDGVFYVFFFVGLVGLA